MKIRNKEKIAIVLVGRSGSGKGTQAQFIIDRLGRKNIVHLETGRFIRDFIKKYPKNPATKIGVRILRRGELFPSWFAIFGLLKEILEHGKADSHLLFDGAPRTVWQARLIDEILAWYGRRPAVCVYIDISKKIAESRMVLRARTDDREKAIQRRMMFFSHDVLPAVSYYRRSGHLIRINGLPPPEEVSRAVDHALVKRFGKLWPR